MPASAPPPPPADVLASRARRAGGRRRGPAPPRGAAGRGRRARRPPADGSPGHDASVALVADALRAAGFAVETPEFRYPVEVVLARHVGWTATGCAPTASTGSPETPADGVDRTAGGGAGRRRPRAAAPTTSTRSPVPGAVLLVRRGGCPFATKAARAADAGAAALLVVNDEPGPLTGGTLRERGRLPVAGVSTGRRRPAGRARRHPGGARPADPHRDPHQPQRRRPDPDRAGPTTSSWSAATSTASRRARGSTTTAAARPRCWSWRRRWAPSPPSSGAVRFAWWGGEEVGLLGSQAYVDGLDASRPALARAVPQRRHDRLAQPGLLRLRRRRLRRRRRRARPGRLRRRRADPRRPPGARGVAPEADRLRRPLRLRPVHRRRRPGRRPVQRRRGHQDPGAGRPLGRHRRRSPSTPATTGPATTSATSTRGPRPAPGRPGLDGRPLRRGRPGRARPGSAARRPPRPGPGGTGAGPSSADAHRRADDGGRATRPGRFGVWNGTRSCAASSPRRAASGRWPPSARPPAPSPSP